MTTDSKTLMKEVRQFYLKSGDFNGLPFRDDESPERVDEAIALVSAGLVQMVTEVDFPNPHIRPWPSRRSIEEQTQSFRTEHYACLYPTSAGMKGVRLPRRLSNRPYETEIARGRGVLELAFFSMDVLEPYRNDHRYSFRHGDFDVNMAVSDDVYLDATEPDHDKVSLGDIGFAYDLRDFVRDDEESPIVRRATAFYGDLGRLSPEHQQRWKTYQIANDDLKPHPLWYGAQMGNWNDGIGPFTRLFILIGEINELYDNIWDAKLFRVSEKPDEFGWVLRAGQRDWDEFVQELDKILSDNLRDPALTKAKVVERDGEQRLGTLQRLQRLMESNGVKEVHAKKVLGPLASIRAARQDPAHKLRQNVEDSTLVHRQVNVLQDVLRSLRLIRYWLQEFPVNSGWQPEFDDLKDYIM